MHKVVGIFMVGFLLSSVAAAAMAGQPSYARDTSPELAGLETAAFQRDLAMLSAPIKSEGSLRSHVSAGLDGSPLRYLSRPALERFLSSLQFNENGLTSYRYSDLELELTPSQIYQVLSLFGQQHGTPMLRGAKIRSQLDMEIMAGPVPGVAAAGWEQCDVHSPSPGPSLTCGDKRGYRCMEPGTCAENSSTICTSNC